MLLNYNILILILDYLCIQSLKNIKKITNDNIILYDLNIKINKKLLYIYFNKLKNNNIYLKFKGSFFLPNFIDKFPILKFDKKFIGNTGYIDNITCNDMKESIMVSYDNIFKRPFLCIKYFDNAKDFYDCDYEFELQNKFHILVIFQRYSDCKYRWCFSNTNNILLKNDIVELKDIDIKKLYLNIDYLLNNEKILFYEYNYNNEFTKIIEKFFDCILI